MPVQTKRCIVEGEVNNVPTFLSPQDYLSLCFEEKDAEFLKQFDDLPKKQDEINRLERFHPQIIIRIDVERDAQDIFKAIRNMYDSKLMQISMMRFECDYYIGIIYNMQYINYNTFWYCVPKEYKRFVARTPVYLRPPFVPEDVFEKLQFSREDYFKV